MKVLMLPSTYAKGFWCAALSSLLFSSAANAHHEYRFRSSRCGETDRKSCTRENKGLHDAIHAACHYMRTRNRSREEATIYIFGGREIGSSEWFGNWMSANNQDTSSATESTKQFSAWVDLRESPGWALSDFRNWFDNKACN
jgi:hypothetical protein